jgi:hypothetical protein
MRSETISRERSRSQHDALWLRARIRLAYLLLGLGLIRAALAVIPEIGSRHGEEDERAERNRQEGDG